jgi:DNA-binding SARP family transcriptional activator
MPKNAPYLRLLGACGVFASDLEEAPRILGPGKPLLLLARLQVEPQGVPREQLATFLWDDLPDHRARASLRQALHLLRQALGPDAVDGDRHQVRLTSPLPSDLTRFLEAVRTGVEDDVIRWYGGPFMADLTIGDANEAEQWIVHQRRRCSQHFIGAASALVTRRLRAGDPSDTLSRRLLETDPSRVASWGLRLEALTLADDRTGVRETVTALQRALAQEDALESGSGSEARRLIARYTAAERVGEEVSDAGTSGFGLRSRFVGRRTELLQLRGLWDGVRRERQGSRLLVSGHAGIGKSRLLAEFAPWPPLDGATVLWVRARRGGRDDRYAYLVDLIGVLTSRPGSIGIMQESAGALVGLVPSLVSLFPGAMWQQAPIDDATLLAKALRDLLLTLAEEHPLVLLLDDLHAADPSSLRVLDDATATLDGVPLAIVAASRPRASLFGTPWPTIELGPLEQEQVAIIVADVEQVRLDPAVTVLLATTTGGVPLHAVQALRSLAASGLIAMTDRTWCRVPGTESAPIPTPRDLVAHLVTTLSPPARQLLAALALADQPLAITDLQRLTRLPAGIRERLEELEEADLVQRADRDRWQVGHDVVADTALHDLPLDQRREVALELATHLAPHASAIADMRRVVRYYLDAAAPDAMLQAVRAWHARTPEAPRGEALADVLLATGVAPSIRRRLIRLIPLRERARRQLLVAVVATATLLGAALLLWLRQPSRLELLNTPTYAWDMGVPPLFEVRDRLGRIVTALDGRRATVTLLGGADSLTGTRSEPVRDGILSLDSLQVWEAWEVSGAPVQLAVDLPGLPRRAFTLRAPVRDSLWIEEAVLAGQPVSARTPVIRVAAGAPITGWVRLRYTSRAAAILIMMTQFANWMPPQQDTTSVTSMITPAERAFVHIRRIQYTAPKRPGRYWLAWTFTSEPAAVWIASSTSWRCGTPVWTDGNEKHQLGDSVFASVWGHGGEVRFSKLLCDPGKPRFMQPTPLPLVSLRVEVE